MRFDRSSGILLHPTSLPGPYGIGDLGPEAHKWVDFVASTGCALWQVLPLGPTGYGDSPYQCFSAFAGNPYLISIDDLISLDLLGSEDLQDMPNFPVDNVDFGAVIFWKIKVLDRAFERFNRQGSKALKEEMAKFRQVHAAWLVDFGLFMALKDAHGGAPWHTWEPALRDRRPKALKEAIAKYAQDIDRHVFRQFIFFREWNALRAQAHVKGIKIVGDIPIFVAHDSADVWANPGLFYMDEEGKPSVQAGVPPDYFSPTGQLWGNPLYRWDVHKASGYAWWMERMRSVLSQVDIVRLDHFRGFAGYWEVPGDATDAVKGQWVPGPGADFFSALRKNLGDLPIIAEDLGDITPDVIKLRDAFELPGMKIFQFAFGGKPEDPFLPHNYLQNCVVYTGTHDNDTARGWYERINESERDFFRRYMDRSGDNVAWDMIRGSWGSVAAFAVAPMQDFLNLGNEARMNYPGRLGGNWTWRMKTGDASEPLQNRIRDLNYMYSRLRKDQ